MFGDWVCSALQSFERLVDSESYTMNWLWLACTRIPIIVDLVSKTAIVVFLQLFLSFYQKVHISLSKMAEGMFVDDDTEETRMKEQIKDLQRKLSAQRKAKVAAAQRRSNPGTNGISARVAKSSLKANGKVPQEILNVVSEHVQKEGRDYKGWWQHRGEWFDVDVAYKVSTLTAAKDVAENKVEMGKEGDADDLMADAQHNDDDLLPIPNLDSYSEIAIGGQIARLLCKEQGKFIRAFGRAYAQEDTVNELLQVAVTSSKLEEDYVKSVAEELDQQMLSIWHRHVDRYLVKALTNPGLLATKKGKRGQSCIDVNVTKQAEVANELSVELMTVLMKTIEEDDIESFKIGLQKMDDLENVVDEKVRTMSVKLQKLQVDQPGMAHKRWQWSREVRP